MVSLRGLIIITVLATAAAGRKPDLPVTSGPMLAPSCMVFNSQRKSASSTITNLLLRSFVQNENLAARGDAYTVETMNEERYPSPPVVDGHRIKVKVEPPKLAPRRIMFGDQASALFAANPEWNVTRCLWFTLFREPADRLASALFYCREYPREFFCGDKGKEWFYNATIVDMARFWGNYQFRELIMAAGLPPYIEAPRDTLVRWTPFTRGRNERAYSWQLLREHLHEGEDDPATAAGKLNFKRVVAMLRTQFSAVGVVSKFPEFCALMDILAPLPQVGKSSVPDVRMSWTEATALYTETHNTVRWSDEEHKARAQGKASPEVRRLLAGDILVYEEAVKILSTQLTNARKKAAPAAAIAANERMSARAR